MLLTGPHWLEDQVIAYFFNLMASRDFSSSKMLFLPPSVAQLIKCSSEDSSIFLEPIDAKSKDLIVLPVNDNESEGAGGSHWSLLVFSRRDDAFFSFDSLGIKNAPATVNLVNKLKHSLRCPFADFVKSRTLQQSNAYDCGVHVIANAENVAKHFVETGSVWNTPILSAKTGHLKRRQLFETVQQLSGIVPGTTAGRLNLFDSLLFSYFFYSEPMITSELDSGDALPADSIKVQLAKALIKLPCAKSRYGAAVKRVPWGGINIPGCSAKDLQHHLKEIIKLTTSARSLEQILTEFQTKQNMFSSPSRPSSALMKYVCENQEKIHGKIKARNPDKIIQFVSFIWICFTFIILILPFVSPISWRPAKSCSTNCPQKTRKNIRKCIKQSSPNTRFKLRNLEASLHRLPATARFSVAANYFCSLLACCSAQSLNIFFVPCQNSNHD